MPAERRFLVINPFGIGDVLFSTALLRCLKSSIPAARIFYLCNRKTAPLLSSHPLIDGVVIYERDEFLAARRVSLCAWWKMFREFIGRIRSLRCDTAIDLSLNTQYGFFAWAAGIRNRVGLDYKRRCHFLNSRIAIDGFTDKHVAEYYLDLLGLLGIARVGGARLEISSDFPSRKWADGYLVSKNIDAASVIIGIAPCGGDAFGKDAFIKRWPIESYTGLINRLLWDAKNRVFLFAGPKEKEDIAAILSGVTDASRVSEFCDASLPQTVALVEKCSLFISNDTGPLRFADGLNRKIVALFGPVDEKIYGPYPMEQGRTIVLSRQLGCRPCYHRFRLTACSRDKECLRSITVDEVCAAAATLLKGH